MTRKVASQKNHDGKSTEKKSQAVYLMKGLAISYALTCIIFIAYALILTYTDISEKNISLVSILCTVVATALAGFDSAKHAESRGMLWGVLAGFLYAIILFFIIWFSGNGIRGGVAAVTTLLISLAGGAIGGIFGINAKG